VRERRYEYRTAEGEWFRCYGLEDWTFAKDGKMRKRQMSGNDVKIEEGQRWFKWVTSFPKEIGRWLLIQQGRR
jgi:nuclear transport factor 2 (NTF2) superfamily protein